MCLNYRMIPIIIICFNNYKYVENTIRQISNINIDYVKYIQIMDNCSTCENTINYLKQVNCNVIYNKNNDGPWINSDINVHVYNTLPDKFIITDPDLEFNENLPSNFIDTLLNLSNKYSCYKVGFALDLSDFDKMYQGTYVNYGDPLTIYEWEERFWYHKVIDPTYELYAAGIDTTFCLINKFYEKNHIDNVHRCIRVAGNFTAKHLPWYIDNKVYSVYENYLLNKSTPFLSSSSKMINKYITDNYIQVYENNQIVLVKK